MIYRLTTRKILISYLCLCLGGVAGAIKSACGGRVQEECDSYLKTMKIREIKVSQVG